MKQNTKIMSEGRFALILLAPTLLLILGLLLYPLIYSIYLSFVDLNITNPDVGTEFVGFRNFMDNLSDPAFWNSLKITFYFAVVTVIGSLLVGLYAALLLNSKIRARGLFRTLLLIPWAIPLVIVGMIWKLILHPNYGSLNALLMKVGIIHHNIAWLSDAKWSLIMLFLSEIWRSFPFVALLYLAALQTIPQDLFEAASVDGATKRKAFWHITMPYLQATTLVLLILRTIDAFRSFDLIFALTKGGPANNTEIVGLYLYKQGFTFANFGVSAAGSYIVTFLILVLVFVYIKLMKVQNIS
ncbi:ABC-type sugar transport system permease subunit [Paenibacillus baekrokdamisoli]|uniref:carbohydrate ABC transporter permease n=1 Tax=Paenibacillus baekrokdamisoli TaxID=1712516 RepID=UPI000F77AF3C|nr:sugar ABC transporter permease [Paenibacillus baekrokdamisoli]MBB3072869.1 ABC-type sugar transport system permease subunit [Paenibacillus baekrokdamisoli]